MKIREKIHTVNGFKVKEIYEVIDHEEYGEIEDYIGSDIETPHCGWVDNTCTPSFDCKKCDENCPEYKKWTELFEDYL